MYRNDESRNTYVYSYSRFGLTLVQQLQISKPCQAASGIVKPCQVALGKVKQQKRTLYKYETANNIDIYTFRMCARHVIKSLKRGKM